MMKLRQIKLGQGQIAQWFVGLSLMLAMLSSSVQAKTVDQTDPYRLIDEVAQITFARLKAEQPNIAKNPEILRTIVNEELLPYVNARYAAYKVLGNQQLKKSTKDQRDAFVVAFEDYMIASYAQVMTKYSDQTVKVEAAQPVPADRKIVTVRVDLIEGSHPPLRIDFKLRKNKDGTWQAFDMVAEGISMVQTKQSEWRDPLKNKGIEAVTQELQRLGRQPIRLDGDDVDSKAP
ncbi:Intermembrane phospholipid transport system binding protein MlaC [Vibrio stylophorae]|uniref:Intermembrane phospholipid transport system binding protein MlaC n=1 Tax=Vibrio stylophorae TaxID=659351 RepID=A0ABM8ZQD0_9VIBR|nr:Intermembrane phospholipid transport system binding protein MlaC [Vibrio stylophorae]